MQAWAGREGRGAAEKAAKPSGNSVTASQGPSFPQNESCHTPGLRGVGALGSFRRSHGSGFLKSHFALRADLIHLGPDGGHLSRLWGLFLQLGPEAPAPSRSSHRELASFLSDSVCVFPPVDMDAKCLCTIGVSSCLPLFFLPAHVA